MTATNYTGALEEQLQRNYNAFGNTHLQQLARNIIEGGKRLDLREAQCLKENPSHLEAGIKRDIDNPLYHDDSTLYDDENADDPKFPLGTADFIDAAPLEHANDTDEEQEPPPQEKWNEGRRATSSGIEYDLDENALPRNPYMNTGLSGRGELPHFGPNHVSMHSVLLVKNDERGTPTLYATGTQDENKTPCLLNDLIPYEIEDGEYAEKTDYILGSRIEGLFNYFVKGSVKLLPEYKAMGYDIFLTALQDIRLEEQREPTQEEVDKLHKSINERMLIIQVMEIDPFFGYRLQEFLAQGNICFAGPLLNDDQSTNNAWIEGQLSWSLLDTEAWDKMRDSFSAFDYQLDIPNSDDSEGQLAFHRIDADLLENATPKHAPLFAYMSAAFILECEVRGEDIPQDVMNQITAIKDYLDTIPEPAYLPEPQGQEASTFITQSNLPNRPQP